MLLRAIADPRSVDVLPHGEALVRFRPTITLCVNHPQPAVPLPPGGRQCVWVLDESAVPASPAAADTVYLAASPRIADVLRQAGVRDAALRDWFWACESDEGQPPAGEPADAVLLVADLPPVRPEIFGVRQPTHQQLWSHLRDAAGKLWQTPKIAETQRLLERAARDCGVELRDRTLRDNMLQLIERAIVPAAALEAIAATLAVEAAELLVLGRGWERLTIGNLRRLADDLLDLPDRGAGITPRACVVVTGGADPFRPALLHAATRGWPLLLHCPAGRPPGRELGDVLRPGQHFEPFSGLPELRAALHALRDAPQAAAQRVARARRHVQEHHSYSRRLEALADYLHYDPGRSNL